MDYTEVLEALQSKGIAIRVASPKLVMVEAPQSDTVLTRTSRGLRTVVRATRTGLPYRRHRAACPRAPTHCTYTVRVQPRACRMHPVVHHRSYKDVNEVVDTCHAAGISSKCVKLRPIAVIKG